MVHVVTDSEGKQVVDLAASFGHRFKVSREADGATWEKWPVADRVWLLEIRGRYGLVHPHGGDTLIAVVDAKAHPHVAVAVRALPFLTGLSDGAEIRAHFPAERLEEVAELLELRRRRRLSPEQWARNAERLAAYRFDKGENHARERAKTALESTQSTG
jgi:hypothetical protein